MDKIIGAPVALCLLLLFGASCSRKPPTPPVKSGEAVVEQPDSINSIAEPMGGEGLLLPQAEPRLFASLKRTPCYGRCPVYEVQFYSNGQALYNGERNVQRQGIYLASVPDSTIRRILEKAEEIRFFSLSNLYPENGKPIADLPQSIIYFNDGRQEKTITNNHLPPKELLAFERLLDSLAAGLNWQPKVD